MTNYKVKISGKKEVVKLEDFITEVEVEAENVHEAQEKAVFYVAHEFPLSATNQDCGEIRVLEGQERIKAPYEPYTGAQEAQEASSATDYVPLSSNTTSTPSQQNEGYSYSYTDYNYVTDEEEDDIVQYTPYTGTSNCMSDGIYAPYSTWSVKITRDMVSDLKNKLK